MARKVCHVQEKALKNANQLLSCARDTNALCNKYYFVSAAVLQFEVRDSGCLCDVQYLTEIDLIFVVPCIMLLW